MKKQKSLSPLTLHEWNIVNDYILLMKPIAISLDKLQGEKNVSIGCVLPCLHSIQKEISQTELQTKSSNNMRIQLTGKAMKNSLMNAFKKRFSSFMPFDTANRTLILAAVSHPVYKLKWISVEQNLITAKNYFEEEVQCMYNNGDSSENNTQETEEENEDDEFLPNISIISSRRSTTDLGMEILNFLEDKDKNLSMLSKYPNIARVFRKYNTTLSASSPIERLFSQALIVCTPRRNRISHINFEKTLLLKQNKELW